MKGGGEKKKRDVIGTVTTESKTQHTTAAAVQVELERILTSLGNAEPTEELPKTKTLSNLGRSSRTPNPRPKGRFDASTLNYRTNGVHSGDKSLDPLFAGPPTLESRCCF